MLSFESLERVNLVHEGASCLCKKVNYPLKNDFTISRGTKTAARNVLLAYKANGITAWGEAAPNPRYNETQDSAYIELNEAMYLYDWQSLMTHENVLSLVSSVPEFKSHAARCGFEMLLLDYWGKAKKKSLYNVFGSDTNITPISSFTIGMGDPESIAKKINEAEPYPILKVKLGGGNDEELIKFIRKHTDKPIRVDANEGWKTVENALKMANFLVKHNVELVEQPLAADQKDELIEFKKKSPLPVCADESFTGTENFAYLSEAFHIVNIKVMKVGSVYDSFQLLKQAHTLGLKVMIGCMLESQLAIAAAAAVATQAEYCDLDAHELLAVKPFSGIEHTSDFRLILDEKAFGLGVKDETSLESFVLED